MARQINVTGADLIETETGLVTIDAGKNDHRRQCDDERDRSRQSAQTR